MKCLASLCIPLLLLLPCLPASAQSNNLKAGFLRPPADCRPGVYWYFMDGNMNAESITRDLESMKTAGIGQVVFLEVNVGIPRGNVTFLSDEWLHLFSHLVKEATRLGISVTLGIGPGWTGSGGPWVTANRSMQTLVASETVIQANDAAPVVLPVPPPEKPFFGEGTLTDELRDKRNAFYEDVAVLAFPAPEKQEKIASWPEKAFYYRAPYTSSIVKPFLTEATTVVDPAATIPRREVLDLTEKMDKQGRLHWRPQSGKWIVMRFGSRNNGAVTRPAPIPGLGFECDKFDTTALKDHLNAYVGRIFEKVGMKPGKQSPGGITFLHMDSWEMGSQNWSQHFRKEFTRRRGYDPLKYFPAYRGYVVDNAQVSERFLWDMRLTTQELIFEYHVKFVKEYAKKYNLKLSIEPYDMNPTSDLELGRLADVPMAEFWSLHRGFNSSFSVIEASSIAHVEGKPQVPAEAFTAQDNEGWQQHPASMKNQGDWAFAAGVNRFVYHTFQNQFLPDSLKPGATMGPYGIHWDRSQTWWPMAGSYHQYVTRCSYLLQQGRTVADILYLAPEGCPHVFVPPSSAIRGDTIGDRREYNFDGCTASQLARANVVNKKIVFPGGATYRVLVLPASETMTPELLSVVERLLKAGAMVIGNPPSRSPSLVNYPACDKEVVAAAKRIWGVADEPSLSIHPYGKGTIISGGNTKELDGQLYPFYETVTAMLKRYGAPADFEANGPVRYTHRTGGHWDIYFVSNTTDKPVNVQCRFRTTKGAPERWDAINGKISRVKYFEQKGSVTSLPLQLDAFESCFIVFDENNRWTSVPAPVEKKSLQVMDLSTEWKVAFDKKWGGPEMADFSRLQDWSRSPDSGIRYYSGIAAYTKTFDYNASMRQTGVYLYLGKVCNLARITLNGKELGTVWTAPWRIDISTALKQKNNVLKIEVANLWANRLIGDERRTDDGIKNGAWPQWLINGTPRPGNRYTFTTSRQYNANSRLFESGLLGPVTIAIEDE